MLQRRVITGERLTLLQVTLKKGCVVPKYVPANVPHKVEVLEDTLNVKVFSPPRQDRLHAQHRAHGQSET
jgi:quercetin dioxygenase-like cupin family protein